MKKEEECVCTGQCLCLSEYTMFMRNLCLVFRVITEFVVMLRGKTMVHSRVSVSIFLKREDVLIRQVSVVIRPPGRCVFGCHVNQ